MKLLLYLIFLIFFLETIQTQNTFLGHTYQIILWNQTLNGQSFSWQGALEDAHLRGGYLATITKQAEMFYLNTQFSLTTAPYVRPFIGGNSVASVGTKFYWVDGPENGELFFDRDQNRGYLFNYWAANQPDRANPLTGAGEEFFVNLHPSMWNDYQTNASAVLGYLLETGGENDPYMSGVDTDGTELTFKNVIGYSKTGLQISVVSVNGKKSNFDCPFKEWLTETSFSCYKHYPMAGEYNITISDSTGKTFTMELVHPNVAYVSSVVPSLVAGGLVTMNGNSFSDSISDLNVSISSNNVQCTPLYYLIPHRSFVCSLTADLFPNTSTNPMMAQITVGVNGVYLAGRTRIPFYNPVTDHLIMNGGNFYYEIYSTYKLEGKVAEPFTPLLDYSLFGRLENYPMCFSTYYNATSSSFILTDTDKSGSAIVTITNNVASCNSSVFSGCGTFDASVTTLRTAPLGYTALTSKFLSPNTTAITNVCKLAYILSLPTANPYFTSDPIVYLVSTYGDYVYIPITNMRLTSSNYTITQGGVKFTQPLSPNWEFMGLEIYIPSGTGSHYLANGNLTIYVDGRSSGLSNSYIGYLPPTINSTEPAGPPTTGGLVTVFGDSFGDVAENITIIITPYDGNQYSVSCEIIVPHQILSFNLQPGSGRFSVTVSVSGQTSTYYTNYGEPIFNEVIQDEKQLYLNVSNILNTYDASLMSLELNSNPLNINYVNSSWITTTLPDDSYDGLLVLTVNTVSNSYNLTLQPIISTIKNVRSGESTPIEGFFLYQPVQIQIGGGFCNNILSLSTTLIICTPIGIGLDLSVSVELNNSLNSNLLEFSYGPEIYAIYYFSPNQVKINGDNFDSDTLIFIENALGTFDSIVPDLIQTQSLNASLSLTQRNTNLFISSNQMNSSELFLQIPPYLTDITSVNSNGGQVTISGNFLNFVKANNSENSVSVTIGGLLCNSPKQIVDNTQMECTVPAGTGANLAVVVTIDSSTSNTIFFGYGKPHITTITQNYNILNITGDNFGSNIAAITVTLNNISLPCAFDEYYSLSCGLKASDPHFGELILVVSYQFDNKTINIIPIINDIVPRTSNSTSITVNGWFLRQIDSSDIFSGLVDSTPCQSITSFTDQDYLICNLENSNVLSKSNTPSISITINSLQSNSIKFEYSTPYIVSITQNQTNLTITGNTFGNLDSSPIITLNSNDLTCDFIQYQTQIQCTIPDSSISSTLNLTNYFGSSTMKFNMVPILMNSSPTPTSGGQTEITGLLLGDILGSLVEYSILINENIECDNIQLNENSISCSVPDSLPVNSSIQMVLETSQKTNEIQFNYLAPSIDNFDQTISSSITINGDNFGNSNDNLILSTNNLKIQCLVITNNIQIECDLEEFLTILRNGNSKIQRNSIESLDFNLNLRPFLNLVQNSVNPSGGNQITIKGEFLNLENYSNQMNTISIMSSVGEGETIKSLNSQTIIISLPLGSFGQSNNLNISINSLSSNSINYSVSLPNLQSTHTNGKLFYPSDGGYVTILGENFINRDDLTTISIGGVACTSVRSLGLFKSIECFFDASATPNGTDSLLVQIGCDGLADEKYLFLYDISNSCLGQPECSGNGECYNGKCQCKDFYTGIQCEINKNNTTPQNPGTIDPDGASFLTGYSVFFTHIREIDSVTKNVVLIYPVSDIKWTVQSNSSNQMVTSGQISDTSIQVGVNTTLFTEDVSIDFAGESMQMSSGSLKYQLSISNWTFSSQLNTLEIIYSIQSPQSQIICDDSIASTSTIDNQDDIRTIQIELNGKIFSSQFSKRVLNDGRVSYINTKLLDSTDSIYQTSFYQSTQNVTVVSISLPHFNDNVIIDPSFQLLLDTNFEKTETDCITGAKKKKSLWYISLIVVGTLGCASAIIGTIIYRRKKTKMDKFKSSLRSLN